MKKILSAALLALLTIGFSSRKIDENRNPYLVFEDCKGSFSKNISKSKQKIDQLITTYKEFPCFPLEALRYLSKKHKHETWILSEISKLRILPSLSNENQLRIITKLLPFTKQKSEIEKYLLKSIRIKNKLGLSIQKELNTLWSKFPSHNPNRLKSPDLSVVKDLKRRGQSGRALELLKQLHRKNRSDLRVQRNMVSTQKNISRNVDYLIYSQQYVDSIYKEYKRRKKNTYYKNLYIKEALKNIRRIWTYQSAHLALKKLDILIKYHCKPVRKCAEHYWIKGRIHEELSELNKAHVWLKKAVETTSLNESEYQNRVWNLVWLESKILGPKPALYSSNFYLSNINQKEIHSRLYYWMHRWSETKKDQDKYVNLIKKYYPMSFYLWSKYALGQGIELKTQKFSDFKKNLSTPNENNALRIMEAGELSLAQAYTKHIEKTQKVKKTLNWKKLKALSGMYLDLLLDLNAGLIKASENIQFFFSRGFYDDVLSASTEFSIDKELIWSVTRQESNFNPYARSWADAFGLMQILPKRAVNFLNDTKKDPNIQPIQAINPFKLYDPSFNISIGAWLLRENLRNFDGKLPLAIAAYNASANKVEEWERRFYTDDWMLFMEGITYRETRKYVKLVLRNREIYSALEKSAK